MSTANTIYEYYERTATDRYYVARMFALGDGKRRLKHLWQPMAVSLRVRGYEDFDLFMYREGRTLMICEALTGATVVNQAELATRELRRLKQKELLTQLPRILLDRGGAPMINLLIVNFLADYEQEISPRYKAKKV